MFPAAGGGCPPPPPYDVAVQQQPFPQHYLQQQSLPGPSTSYLPTSSQQLSGIMDRTVHVDDFTTAMLQYMEEAAGPSSSSGGAIPSSTNAASFIVPLNYGPLPHHASSPMVAPPPASNGHFRTMAVNINECTSNQWLEAFRHLHISQLGGPDLFQQQWPEYAGIEHAFVEKRKRYTNAKAVLGESLAPHVPDPAWRAVFKGAKIEFVNSVQRLDRFVWLIRHRPLELRAMLDKQKTFNEIFRTLQLPSGSRADALRNDLYDWEEEHGSSLLDVSIFFRKSLIGIRSVEYRCLFDDCTFAYVRSNAKGLKFNLQTHLNGCHGECLIRATIPAQNDPIIAPSVALVSTLPVPGSNRGASYSSQPLHYASSSIQNQLMRPPIASVHTAHDPASLPSQHALNPFAAAMIQIPQMYRARLQSTAPVAQPYTAAQHSYPVQPPTAPIVQPYSLAQHAYPVASRTSVVGSVPRHQASWHSFVPANLPSYPGPVHPQPVPDSRPFAVRPPAAPSAHAVSLAQQGLLQPYATFRRGPHALAETRPEAVMVHTSNGQGTLVPQGSRTYRTTSGAHYSSIREPQVAVGTRPAAYQAQPTTFRPHVQQPVVTAHDQWLQASGGSTAPLTTLHSSPQSSGMQQASSSFAGRHPILHRALSGQAVTSPPRVSTSRTVEEVVTISDDDDDESVVVAASATSAESAARSTDVTASLSNVEDNAVTEGARVAASSMLSGSATGGSTEAVLASGRRPQSRSHPLTYKRDVSGNVKCDFCENLYTSELGVRCHYNKSHRKQREGRKTVRKETDSPRKRLQVPTCPAVMALPLRSSPRSIELRREWPEFAELLDDFNDKWKRYVGYQSELSSKGVTSSPTSAASARLEEYFKEYRAAKWAVEKFELLSEKCAKELRKLLDMGTRFEDACEDLLATVAKRTTGNEATASEEEVESRSGPQASSGGASTEQSDGRCSSPTDCLAAAIIATVKKEEPRDEEPPVTAEASEKIAMTPDPTPAKKNTPEAISSHHDSLRPTSDAARAIANNNASDNRAATVNDKLPTTQRGRRLKRRSWLTPKKTPRKAPISAKYASKPLIVTSKPITSPTFYHTGWESFEQLKHLRLQLQSATQKGTTQAESEVHLQVACIRSLIRHARQPLHDLLREGRTVDEIIASLESKLPFALLRKLRERRFNRIHELEELLKGQDLMPTDFHQFFEQEGDTFYCLFNDCDATLDTTTFSDDLDLALKTHCGTEHFAL